MRVTSTAYRFKCRRPGETGWTVYLGLTTFQTAETAAALIARWTKRDGGLFEWTCEKALRTDIDYPGNYERSLRRLALARKAKQRRAQKEWAGLVSAGLA